MVRRNLLNIIVFLILLCWSTASYALDLGTFGVTYQIAEKDALTAIKDVAKAKDWQKAFNDRKFKSAILSFKPDNLQKLPVAKKTRTFQFKMEYVLEFDVKDDKGNIIYPKGFIFNPLEYITFPTTLIVIDGTDKKQVAWFQQSPHGKDANVMLLVTDGNYSELMKSLNRPVYYANDVILQKFHLQATPSIVRQSQAYLEVNEVEIDK